MKAYKRITILPLILLFFSCETEIELEINFEESKLVANAALEAGKTPEIYIFQSTNPLILRRDRSILMGAHVELVNQNGMTYPLYYIEELKERNGFLELFMFYGDSNMLIDEKNNYELIVSHSDFEPIDAETEIIPAFEKSHIDFEYIHVSAEEAEFDLTQGESYPNILNLDFYKTNEKQRYLSLLMEYEMILYNPLGDTVGRRISTLALSSSIQKSQNGADNQLLLDLDNLELGKHKIQLNATSPLYGWRTRDDSEVHFNLKAQLIDEKIMNYYSSLRFNSLDNPFQEPTPVYNNINGGYGIFGSAYNLEIKKSQIIEP